MKREEADAFLHQKVEDGELISPVLPDGVKNYLIDIDGTVLDWKNGESGLLRQPLFF